MGEREDGLERAAEECDRAGCEGVGERIRALVAGGGAGARAGEHHKPGCTATALGAPGCTACDPDHAAPPRSEDQVRKEERGRIVARFTSEVVDSARRAERATHGMRQHAIEDARAWSRAIDAVQALGPAPVDDTAARLAAAEARVAELEGTLQVQVDVLIRLQRAASDIQGATSCPDSIEGGCVGGPVRGLGCLNEGAQFIYHRLNKVINEIRAALAKKEGT